MTFGGKKQDVRESILELGKDTDAQVCEKLGGEVGSDGKCRTIYAGVGEDGDVHLRASKRSGIPRKE